MVLNVVKGTIFVFLIGLGVVGNVLVLVNYMVLFRSTMKSIHLILIHLAFTNMITLLTRGMPRTVSSLGLRSLIDDIACKVVVYLSRVARGLSICTTSLLTVVQAITISPRASRWRRLQPRSAWHLLPLLLFFWILNSVISMNLPFYIKHIRSMNTSEVIRSDNVCYFQSQNWTIGWIFIVLMVLRDAVFQSIMGWTSGHMVFLLHKHHQQVLHLQTSKLLHRTPPEVKAAKSVLLLMLCFLLFYWTNCFMSLYVTFSLENNFIEVSAVAFVDLGYAVLSPLVLIHREGHLAECWHLSISMIFNK
ncbi:putative vomeronasal receptor-like protein 4 [Callospermophilus lateralis]|uniref:putative vomeronasal receptor-like protein 4 n=1 Tax=Callospermophilus lateralis TaxID=76772 RepID=UPI004053E2E8